LATQQSLVGAADGLALFALELGLEIDDIYRGADEVSAVLLSTSPE
jgi:hypothetical protein